MNLVGHYKNILTLLAIFYLAMLFLGTLPLFAVEPEKKNSKKVDKIKLAVLDIQPNRGIEKSTAFLLSEYLISELQKTKKYDVIGKNDIKQMLQFEEQRELLDSCRDDGCLIQISGALGVDQLAAMVVGRIGSTHLVVLKVIDVRKARVLQRITRQAEDTEGAILAAITSAVQEAAGFNKGGWEKMVVKPRDTWLGFGILVGPAIKLGYPQPEVRILPDTWEEADWGPRMALDVTGQIFVNFGESNWTKMILEFGGGIGFDAVHGFRDNREKNNVPYDLFYNPSYLHVAGLWYPKIWEAASGKLFLNWRFGISVDILFLSARYQSAADHKANVPDPSFRKIYRKTVGSAGLLGGIDIELPVSSDVSFIVAVNQIMTFTFHKWGSFPVRFWRFPKPQLNFRGQGGILWRF